MSVFCASGESRFGLCRQPRARAPHSKRAAGEHKSSLELCPDADKFGEVSDNGAEVSDISSQMSDTSHETSDTARQPQS
ncbi:hypothetical protein [Sporosarcina koreensis]|uniref:hypothetical protein n=1 Tax=Sporosarcina koreensis TaxID=334735 RepID=UPI001181B2F4|nr:hypothetical protein [Sporosarcina koreensis]